MNAEAAINHGANVYYFAQKLRLNCNKNLLDEQKKLLATASNIFCRRFFSLLKMRSVGIVASLIWFWSFYFILIFACFFFIRRSLLNRQICSLSWLSFQSNFMATTELIQDSWIFWNETREEEKKHHIKVLKFIVANKINTHIKLVSLFFAFGVNVFTQLYLYLKALKLNNWIQKIYIVCVYMDCENSIIHEISNLAFPIGLKSFIYSSQLPSRYSFALLYSSMTRFRADTPNPCLFINFH